MLALPPHPNLEHQQKLAKKLLRAAWAGDAEAIARFKAFLPQAPHPNALKLHDAQLVIARSYGFSSWAAMKYKIESLTKSPIELFDIAVREGDVDRARELLQNHADVRARINEPRFDFDSPAIHQAKKNLALVDLLLGYGADINARSKWWAGDFGILEWNLTAEQARPLIERGARVTAWAAAGLGLFDDLKNILQTTPEVVRQRGGDGKTVLHCAASPEIAQLILGAGPDLEARDVDHGSTALQHLIADETIARLLISHGAVVDIFAAARLGDRALVEKCLEADPTCAEVRVNRPPYIAPGLHIYGWTLGFDLTPADVARKFGHANVVDRILASLSSKGRFIDALWCADGDRARRELARHPGIVQELEPTDHSLLPAAAWWYRPESVRLMLEMGLNPHATGAHRSTALDRASFHGYADIVETLLELDPNPPLTQQNEFGGIPLDACFHGSLNGWETGHPRDHARTVRLLLEAGSPVDSTMLPSGNDVLDSVVREWLGAGHRTRGR
jgi:ankyrin repeat protein